MKLFSFVYIIFRQFPTHIITNLVLLVIMGMAGTISIFSVAPLIDYFMNPDLQNASEITRRIARMVETVGLPVNLGSLLGLFVLLHAIRSGLSALAFYALLKTKYAVMRDFMVGMYDDMFHARWFFFTSNKQGVLLNTFFREVGVVTDGFNAMMFAFAYSVQAAFYLIAPLYLSWQVTSIGLGIALVFTLPFFLLSNVSYRLGQMNTSTANDVGTVINEGFGLVKVIQGFGNQSKSIAQLGKAYDAHRQVTLKSQTLRMAIPLMFEPLGLVVIGISLVAAEWFSVPLANIGAFFLALHYTIRLVASVLAEKNTMMNFYPSYEQVRDIRAHAKQLRQWSGTRPFSGFKQEIAVDGLRFAYPDHDPVLTDIKMRIPKGKMVALVGSSGAGKSTLIDLVMGFHEPSAGHIAFDGVPLREFDVTGYRQRIGYVPQESVLFNLSIRDNLLWAKSDATDEDIETACRQANAEEFIRSFPDGYDTLVGDRGVRLSGGQAQRIALARAILRKPELLILDEATSSLDTESERLIQSAIETIARETTVIVIAHRLSTITNADWIYVLDKGRIVEEGSYNDLVNMDKHFSRMVRMQVLATTE